MPGERKKYLVNECQDLVRMRLSRRYPNRSTTLELNENEEKIVLKDKHVILTVQPAEGSIGRASVSPKKYENFISQLTKHGVRKEDWTEGDIKWCTCDGWVWSFLAVVDEPEFKELKEGGEEAYDPSRIDVAR